MLVKNLSLEPATQATITMGRRTLPMAKRLAFIKMRKALGVAFEAFHELRNELIREHGEEEGINQEMEGWADFEAAHMELLLLEVDLDIEPVSMAEFQDQEFGPEFDILYETGLITL